MSQSNCLNDADYLKGSINECTLIHVLRQLIHYSSMWKVWIFKIDLNGVFSKH